MEQSTPKPWFKKPWVLIAAGIILLSAIARNTDKHEKVKDRQTETETKEKRWIEVYTFKGNGMRKSPIFSLSGAEARIKYKYRAPAGLGIGVFFVYVVDKGVDIMKEGAIPEIMSQAENDESESAIQKGEGEYYLNINASGDWTVTVEEWK